jgi:hypothetical protein
VAVCLSLTDVSSQIFAAVHGHRGSEWRGLLRCGMSLDDELWQDAMVVQRQQEEFRRPRYGSNRPDRFDHEEGALYRLISLGVEDPHGDDSMWDSSARAMRHSSAMSDRLWVLLEKEAAKVREVRTSTLELANHFLVEGTLGDASQRFVEHCLQARAVRRRPDRYLV